MSDSDTPLHVSLREILSYLQTLGANIQKRAQNLIDKKVTEDYLNSPENVQKVIERVDRICFISKSAIEKVQIGVKQVVSSSAKSPVVGRGDGSSKIHESTKKLRNDEARREGTSQRDSKGNVSDPSRRCGEPCNDYLTKKHKEIIHKDEVIHIPDHVDFQAFINCSVNVIPFPPSYFETYRIVDADAICGVVHRTTLKHTDSSTPVRSHTVPDSPHQHCSDNEVASTSKSKDKSDRRRRIRSEKSKDRDKRQSGDSFQSGNVNEDGVHGAGDVSSGGCTTNQQSFHKGNKEIETKDKEVSSDVSAEYIKHTSESKKHLKRIRLPHSSDSDENGETKKCVDTPCVDSTECVKMQEEEKRLEVNVAESAETPAVNSPDLFDDSKESLCLSLDVQSSGTLEELGDGHIADGLLNSVTEPEDSPDECLSTEATPAPESNSEQNDELNLDDLRNLANVDSILNVENTLPDVPQNITFSSVSPAPDDHRVASVENIAPAVETGEPIDSLSTLNKANNSSSLIPVEDGALPSQTDNKTSFPIQDKLDAPITSLDAIAKHASQTESTENPLVDRLSLADFGINCEPVSSKISTHKDLNNLDSNVSSTGDCMSTEAECPQNTCNSPTESVLKDSNSEAEDSKKSAGPLLPIIRCVNISNLLENPQADSVSGKNKTDSKKRPSTQQPKRSKTVTFIDKPIHISNHSALNKKKTPKKDTKPSSILLKSKVTYENEHNLSIIEVDSLSNSDSEAACTRELMKRIKSNILSGKCNVSVKLSRDPLHIWCCDKSLAVYGVKRVYNELGQLCSTGMLQELNEKAKRAVLNSSSSESDTERNKIRKVNKYTKKPVHNSSSSENDTTDKNSKLNEEAKKAVLTSSSESDTSNKISKVNKESKKTVPNSSSSESDTTNKNSKLNEEAKKAVLNSSSESDTNSKISKVNKKAKMGVPNSSSSESDTTNKNNKLNEEAKKAVLNSSSESDTSSKISKVNKEAKKAVPNSSSSESDTPSKNNKLNEDAKKAVLNSSSESDTSSKISKVNKKAKKAVPNSSSSENDTTSKNNKLNEDAKKAVLNSSSSESDTISKVNKEAKMAVLHSGSSENDGKVEIKKSNKASLNSESSSNEKSDKDLETRGNKRKRFSKKRHKKQKELDSDEEVERLVTLPTNKRRKHLQTSSDDTKTKEKCSPEHEDHSGDSDEVSLSTVKLLVSKKKS